MTVPIVVPDTASGTFDVEWSLPTLTLRTAPTTATQVLAAGKLVVTGGTHADLSGPGASVTAGSTSVPAAKVTSTVTVTAATGGQVTVKPSTEAGSLKLGLISDPSAVTSCTTTGTESVVVTVGQGGEDGGGAGTGTQLVDYTCTSDSGTVQDVTIKVTLTLPATDPRAGEQFSIGWSGEYETGAELKAPADGLPAGVKLYAYASISGLTGLTSATGVGTLGTITAGQTITLPTTAVSMKTTSQKAGTAQVKPAAINIGNLPTSPLIECEVKNATTLVTYPLTIGAGGGSTPSDSPSSPTPTTTPTSESPEPTSKRSATPKDGVDTGAGGEAGPDGRAFVLTGSALIMAAGAGGLLLRRRSVTRP
ncbi:hypothetical protein GCM10012289_28980 [Nonomuraea cavernae]|uniref:Uncharacterized protein n=2 Tax=Nonomuraea cavernae TaxID=2045107 RepID=A0A918DJ53_9ACTN|nr:hypothetical protein GCM10012289_28980 [Nonomuraea cavernae]